MGTPANSDSSEPCSLSVRNSRTGGRSLRWVFRRRALTPTRLYDTVRPSDCPLIRLESLLRRHCSGHRSVNRIQCLVGARFVIVSNVGTTVGVTVEGPHNLMDVVSMHFSTVRERFAASTGTWYLAVAWWNNACG